MEAKVITGQDKFRQYVLKAADILGDQVVRTLGPDGLPILIQRKETHPLSTKDGVTVAQHVEVGTPTINTIIEAMKEAARKTNDEAGDGTTTAIALMRSIIKAGMIYIQTGAITPQRLVEGIKKLEPELYDYLDKLATPITDEKKQFSVACISANNDVEIAAKIVEAIKMAGQDGYISLEDGTTRETTVNFVEGYTMATGWNRLGPHGLAFVNNPQKGSIELMKPAVLLYDGPLNDAEDLFGFYNILTQGGVKNVPLLVIAYSFDGTALEFFLANRRVGKSVGLIKCPLHGTPNARRYVMEDLAMLTGGKVINHDLNAISNTLLCCEDNTYTIKEGILGGCNKVTIGKHDSVIYEGYGDEQEKIEYMEALRQQMNDAESEYEKDLIKTRMSKMVGGIVEIGVGGGTELEMKERKFRVEDALNATRAAIEFGVVPGGGVALLKLSNDLKNKQVDVSDVPRAVLIKALEEPIRQILMNAGAQPDVVIAKVLESQSKPDCQFAGYDAKKKEGVNNMIESGIIDPLKVTKFALKNSLSIACELLCGGGMITFEPAQNSLFDKMKPEDLRPDLYLNGDSSEENQSV